MDERFPGRDLDPALWFPYYLPQWSSRAQSVATYQVADGELRLTIPPEQGLWCPDLHEEPLRVSGVQTGAFSGPVGSPVGQQPFRSGLVVREQQDFRGHLQHHGRLEIRARAEISPRSMFSFWLVGLEDEPERSGEINLAEVFGDAVRPGSADVGMGIKAFRDPALTQEFSAEPLPIDVSEFHTYAVDWRPDKVDHFVDGQLVRTVAQSPAYPMGLIIALFDFPGVWGSPPRKDSPAQGDPAGEAPTPALVVSHVRSD